MENLEETNPVQESENETLIITEDIRSYIYDTAKWTKFLSIVGFVGCALTAMAAFSASAVISAVSAMDPSNPLVKLGGGALTAFYLFIALLTFYPSLLLFKYSTSAKTAVLYGDQENLAEAMNKMRSLFKFWGIFTIIIIAIYVVAILLSIVAGIAAAGGGA